MKRIVPTYLILVAMLIGLPLGGVWLTGHDLAPYLEFPPRTQYVQHAPFSWPLFIGLALVILSVMVPFLVCISRASPADATHTIRYPFPVWGWISVILGLLFWLLAWTRLPWMAPFQHHTFTPQWTCFIGVINALTFRRTGRCLLTHETKYFLGLFPLSALFWWFFEYLNRFVQNWYYTGCEHFTPLHYFMAATLPFATVLPAVLSTEEWLASYPRSTAGLQFNTIIRCTKPKVFAWAILIISAAGLFFIGWFPDYLFPLLWVAPLLLLLAFRVLANQPAAFSEVANGNWRRVFRLCLAALICGFFWELWNSHSFAKWIYSVPYVSRFHVFEMPILGYAGYLPFGLECAVIADLIKPKEQAE